MMKKILAIVSWLLISHLTYGQSNSKAYNELITKAESLVNSHDYKNAGLTYSAAFKISDTQIFADHYNAARAWSLTNYPDSAIAQLYTISNLNGFTFDDIHELLSDKDLSLIIDDARLEVIKKKMYLTAYKTFIKAHHEADVPNAQDSTNITYALALGNRVDSAFLHVNDAAYVFLRKKDFDKAYKLFKLCIIHFRHYILYQNIAEYYLEIGNTEKAYENFARSEELKYEVPSYTLNKRFSIDSAVRADYHAFSQKIGYKVLPPSFLISNFTTARLNKEVSSQVIDTFFNTRINNPVQTKKRRIIAFDEGHRNAFKVTGKMKKLGELLENDGYNIIVDTGRFTLSRLLKYDILITGGAVGKLSWDSLSMTFPQAFSFDEIEAIYNWINQGGSLLLMTDHPPFDTSVTALVSKLGSKSGVGIVKDSINSFRSIKQQNYHQGWIIFSKDNKGLSNHPIVNGRNKNEQIHQVMTQGGSSISGPFGSTNILAFSKFAQNEMHRTFVGPTPLQNAQMVAYNLGKGRVVITADGTFFSAQTVTYKDGDSFGLGMSRKDFDNRQLVLNVIHWLSYAVQ